MVCSASDLLGWKDFPKGLKVLLLDNNWNSASDMKTKLEEMDYVVTVFSSEDEALLAISSKTENFHVAIVEVNIDNSNGRLKFLESVKETPTIMTSDIHCLTTMMNCIALGAVEFLKKPLSEEKLKNIWQHVVHKAFNAGGNVSPELLKPIKESMVSESDLKKTDAEMDEPISVEPESSNSKSQESENDQLSNSDKFPAPSTPQIKQGGRFLDDGDYHDQPNSSTDKEIGEQDGECSKSVDTTCGHSAFEVKAMLPPLPQRPVDGKVNEHNLDHHCRIGSEEVDNMSHEPEIKTGSTGATKNPKKETSTPNTGGSKGISNRKKAKVDWTPDLHKKFVQAVEQLGVDQAIPSRILELMKVEGLTRHNVASHLQKYRMQRRHILPKEDQRRWPQPRASSLHRSCYYPPPPHHHRPVMAFPSYHSNHTYPAGSVYPKWPGTPTSQPQNVQMWGAPPLGYPWNSMENWVWKPFPAGMHADAWGCPVLPSPQIPPSAIPEGARGFQSPKSYGIQRNSTECEVADGVIDKIVKEAISKPWLPLPIGLKPPSTDSVLAELSRKGISTVPPPRSFINGDNAPTS